MENKVALVTGGTDGVGLSAVRALMAEAYTVYCVGSNQQKGDRLVAEFLPTKKQHQAGQLHFVQLDLSDLQAVKDFSDDFLKTVPRLDVLLFSAGVMLPKRSETAQGFERTFAIGYLSVYIISKTLSPLLEKTEHARVLTVSGGAPIVLKERLDFDDLNTTQNYNGAKAAARTVHAKVVLSQILAEQFSDIALDSNTFHPGIVRSGLGRNLPWPLNLGAKGAGLLMPRDSKTAIHACLSDTLTGVSGYFLYKDKRIPIKFSEAYRDNLTEASEAMLAGIL